MRPRFGCIGLFLALILAARMAAALDVVVISDLNGSYGSVSYDKRVSAAVESIIKRKPDLVISTGDMVAGQRTPHLSDDRVRAMWAAFHKTVSDPLRQAGIPFVVTPGNHDASAYGGFQRERKIFAQEWTPRKAKVNYLDTKGFPFSYAFEMGGIIFVSLDATTLGPLSGDQMARLEKLGQLGKPIVTFSHLPQWPFAQNREREIIGDPMLEALYRKHGVVLHLSGHHHAYYPGSHNGIAYISQACLGGGARRLIGDSRKSGNSFTVLDISPDGSFEQAAYTGPSFATRLDLTTLPKEIRSPKAVLKRLDLLK